MKKLLIALIAAYSLAHAGVVQQQGINVVKIKICNNTSGGMIVRASRGAVTTQLPLPPKYNFHVIINQVTIDNENNQATIVDTISRGACKDFSISSQDYGDVPATYGIMMDEQDRYATLGYVNFIGINDKILKNGKTITSTYMVASSGIQAYLQLIYVDGYTGIVSPTLNDVRGFFAESEKKYNSQYAYDYEFNVSGGYR